MPFFLPKMIFKTSLRFVLGPGYLGAHVENENNRSFNTLLKKNMLMTQQAIRQPGAFYKWAEDESQVELQRDKQHSTTFAAVQYISILTMRTIRRKLLTFEYPSSWSFYKIISYTFIQTPSDTTLSVVSSILLDLAFTSLPNSIVSVPIACSLYTLIDTIESIKASSLPQHSFTWLNISLLSCSLLLPHICRIYTKNSALQFLSRLICTVQLDRLVASRYTTPFGVKTWFSRINFHHLIISELIEIIFKFGFDKLQTHFRII